MARNDDDFIMLPTVDFCFKELMENPKVRKGFTAAVLNIRPEEILETRLLPTILRKQNEEDKYGILDVRVLLIGGTQLDLEMQVAYFAFWIERTLFYICKMFSEQVSQGDPYEKLQKCIHVSILDFNVFPDAPECYSVFHLNEDSTGRRYSEKLEIQVLELRKIPKNLQQESDVLRWMRFFSGKCRKEFEDMAKEDEYLDEAFRTLVHVSADEEKRLEYEARQKAIRDYNTQIGWAKRLGMETGREQGREAGREEGIEAMILDNLEEGKTKEEIALKLEKRFSLNHDEAVRYLQKYAES